MQLSTAIQDYLLEIEIRRYTPKTIRGYRTNLSLFLRFCEEVAEIEEIEALAPAIVKLFTRHMIVKGCKGTYINGILKTVKSFIQYCYEERLGGFDTRNNFKWCKEDKPIIQAFTPEQAKTILADCKGKSFVMVRDKALLTTLFETGIRCWELCCLRPEDVYTGFLLINGKNHKQRAAPITPILRRELTRYERAKKKYFAQKITEDFYFLSFHGRQLTNSAIEHIVKKHGKKVEGVRVSPHTCRHFFAQQQLKMGTDLYTISRLLGHENVGITQAYLQSLRDEDIVATARQRSVLANL